MLSPNTRCIRQLPAHLKNSGLSAPREGLLLPLLLPLLCHLGWKSGCANNE
jgi:hypothetical protein